MDCGKNLFLMAPDFSVKITVTWIQLVVIVMKVNHLGGVISSVAILVVMNIISR